MPTEKQIATELLLLDNDMLWLLLDLTSTTPGTLVSYLNHRADHWMGGNRPPIIASLRENLKYKSEGV